MMTKAKRKRLMKYRQKQLNRMFAYLMVMNAIIVLMIGLTVVARTSRNNQIEGGNYLTVYESNTNAEVSNVNENDDHNTVIPPANVLPDALFPLVNTETNSTEATHTTCPVIMEFDRGLSEEDKYLLAKMAMAEAESESLEAKVMVILVILNRVESDEPYFPDTISEVIFQKTAGGVYQFTPIGNGRWNRVEPNDECWEAVEIVNTTDHDFSEGALYFESCSGESWHSRNLTFIRQVDSMRFYK